MAEKAEKPSKPGYSQQVPAVAQAAKLLLCLASSKSGRLGLTDISQLAGIHKSKAYSILNTLMDSGLAVRDRETKAYSLGPALLQLSRAMLDTNDLRSLAQTSLTSLAFDTTTTALMGLASGNHLYIVAKEENASGIGITIRVGQRYPLDWGAHGKLFKSYSKNSTSAAPVKYAFDDGEVTEGVRVVASPIFGTTTKPIGCVLALGTFPAQNAETIGERCWLAARELGRLLGPTLEGAYGLPLAGIGK